MIISSNIVIDENNICYFLVKLHGYILFIKAVLWNLNLNFFFSAVPDTREKNIRV